MMARVFEFTSDAFPRTADDDELVNSDSMHGHTLATFLIDELSKRGISAEIGCAEDWGWYCPVKSDGPAETWFGCVGTDNEYFVQVQPEGTHVRRWFRKVPVGEMPDRVFEALFEIVSNSGKVLRGPTRH
ncbi:hypothetical protein A6F68_02365 [Tsuneonella dongtanensis]|uniref:Uncharacterized protein n=1 Tax=Tsuneonella dongtanensis TaxID=692370 RepID=A0A1B2AFE5_9SPHN|nr:hypothetical protein [Tsuneonella dongtanensis]ANY20864.1 hypothetical protein A6F68_02365 [Tsuneonella dongtanensis]